MANSGELSVVVNSVRGLRAGEPAGAGAAKGGDGPQRTAKPADATPGADAPASGRSREGGGAGSNQPLDSEATRAAVEKVQDFVQVVQRDLQFSVDEDSGRTIVTVVDSESGEMIRQIPPERILQIAENLDEVNGILFRGSA